MLDEGGLEAMMFDLKAREIKSNLNKAIVTKALEAQRAIYKATGDSVDIWFDECIGLHNLGVADHSDGEGGSMGVWPDDIDRMELFEAFHRWADNKKIRTKGTAHFYRKVEQYGFVKHRPRTEGIRKWRYKVPAHDKFTTEG